MLQVPRSIKVHFCHKARSFDYLVIWPYSADRINLCCRCRGTDHKAKAVPWWVAPNREGLAHIPGSEKCKVSRGSLEKAKQVNKMIWVLQGNLNRSGIINALFQQLAIERKADVLLLDEQCQKKDSATWYHDPADTAAIWILHTGNEIVTALSEVMAKGEPSFGWSLALFGTSCQTSSI